MAKQTFEQWMAKVDACLAKKCGLSHNDLADCCWYDWYNDGMTPSQAAKQCLEAEGFPD